MPRSAEQGETWDGALGQGLLNLSIHDTLAVLVPPGPPALVSGRRMDNSNSWKPGESS